MAVLLTEGNESTTGSLGPEAPVQQTERAHFVLGTMATQQVPPEAPPPFVFKLIGSHAQSGPACPLACAAFAFGSLSDRLTGWPAVALGARRRSR